MKAHPKLRKIRCNVWTQFSDVELIQLWNKICIPDRRLEVSEVCSPDYSRPALITAIERLQKEKQRKKSPRRAAWDEMKAFIEENNIIQGPPK